MSSVCPLGIWGGCATAGREVDEDAMRESVSRKSQMLYHNSGWQSAEIVYSKSLLFLTRLYAI